MAHGISMRGWVLKGQEPTSAPRTGGEWGLFQSQLSRQSPIPPWVANCRGSRELA